MSCTECGRANPGHAAYCGGCGQPLVTTRPCTVCGQENDRDNTFCHGCGAGLVAVAVSAGTPTAHVASSLATQPEVRDGQRRFLTVLFADLVGSTALSVELDPEDMRDLVLAYQEGVTAAIEDNSGFIAQYLGDGVLAYFGFPEAHEDDARLAVCAGRGIVATAADLQARFDRPDIGIRVGIHSGEVVVSDMGTGDRRQPDVGIGDVPNLAARLQAQAAADSVVISGTTARLVDGWFSWEELGDLPLKGAPQPVRACRITAQTSVRSRLEASARRGLTPLVGRQQELQTLLDTWESVRDGAGRVVTISGEAGIGKSRLVRELQDQAAISGGELVRLHCTPYRSSTALFPVIDHLRKVLGTQGTADEQLDRLEKQLRDADLPVPTTGPLLAELLSIPWHHRWAELGDSAERRKWLTLEATTGWLLAGTIHAPLMLVIEDVHWIDPTTLELCANFFGPEAVDRTLVVITHRSEYLLPWPDRPHVQRLPLDRLAAVEIKHIVQGLAGGKPLPARVAQQIATRTDGVPLFAEEVTHAVLESGIMEEHDDAWVATGTLPEGLVPSTLHESLMARLDRLGEAKELAQLMAVVGREVDERFLRSVARCSDAELDEQLARLVSSDLVRRRRSGARVTYSFKHWLVRDVAYGSLLRATRRRDHARIARLLIDGAAGSADQQPELVAHHLIAAGQRAEAIPYLEHAGDLAYRASAHVEAIRHLGQAVELVRAKPPSRERDQQELTLLIALGAPLTASKGYSVPEVEATYSRAAELCRSLGGEAPQFFRALYGTWRVQLLRADYATALGFARQLLGLAESSGNPVHVAAAHRAVGSTLFYLGGDLTTALHHLDVVIEVGARVDRSRWLVDLQDVVDPWVTCHSYKSWVLWLLGDVDGAEETSRRALSLAEERGHPFTMALAQCFDAWLRQFLDDAECVRDRAQRGLGLAEEQGFPFWIGWARIMIGWAEARLGDPDTGIAWMRQGLDEWRAVGSELGSSYFLTLMAETLVEQGRLEEAASALRDAETVVTQTGERWWDSERLRYQGILALRSGASHDEAVGYLEQAVQAARAGGAAPLVERAAASLTATP